MFASRVVPWKRKRMCNGGKVWRIAYSSEGTMPKDTEISKEKVRAHACPEKPSTAVVSKKRRIKRNF
jgi:hypothetical protein